MFKLIFSFAFVLLAFLANAQIFNTSKELFTNEPFFDIDFIAKNRIKSIKGELHYKRDKEKMLSKNSYLCYEFDTLGRMCRQYSTFPTAGGSDTIFLYFEHDSLNRVYTKRSADNFGFFSYTYVYDDRGNIVKEVYNREVSAGTAAGDFILARQFPMGTEAFHYEYLGPYHFKKKLLNNLGTPYKEILFQINDKKQMLEETGTFLTTGQRERKIFNYNEKGQLTEKAEYSDIAGGNTIKFTYFYDDAGNLIEIKKFKNDEQTQVTEFMINEKGIVTAKLTRHIQDKLIDIIKFTVEYYPEPNQPEDEITD
jgi:hypothetical protein